MNELWTIELLGGLRARRGDHSITRFRTKQTGALLAVLAFYWERRHARAALIEQLWPGSAEPTGRNNLSIALSSLRHQLEPPGTPAGSVLAADRFSVQLRPEAVSTDVAHFEQALAAAARNPEGRMPFLADVVERYRGPLLPDHNDEWILPERERLAERFRHAVQLLSAYWEQAGDLDRALDYAQRAVAADPWSEDARRDLMRLLARAGQPAAALRQYAELERLLADELGDTPSAVTRALARELEDQPAIPLPVPPPRMPRRAPPDAPPVGTVTFLLTDIEGSTALWERTGAHFRTALATHHALLRREFRAHGGHEVKEMGDGFLVAFARASDALSCAAACQRALSEPQWPEEVGAPRVRMALHTGEVERQDGEYQGLVLHRAARLLVVAHGGQILCSEATANLLQRDLAAGIRLRELGVYRVRGLPAPERLFLVEYPGSEPDRLPPRNAEPGYPSNLPPAFTRFFGREREMEQLTELLRPESDVRLVTMTGPGGTGKTRLAQEAARRLIHAFSGAIWFVALADLSDPARIADTVLDALPAQGISQEEPLERIVVFLSAQPSLLVLDNVEHLVEESARLVQTLLARVPKLTCLVTSRQLLGLAGERLFPVPPLATPAGASSPQPLDRLDSIRLFVDRAQAVCPDFQLTEQNAFATATLCERLEGLPLAIELAASRAQVLTPDQILAQIESRFDFLVSRRRDLPERHRTLRSAMDWSYHLLHPELRRFFTRLSVFRGGWTAAAAEAVGEEPLATDALAQLRECSLITAQEHGGEMRFRMLETIREYAAAQLPPQERLDRERRHAQYFRGLAEQAETELRAPDQARWLERLEAEHDNLRAALTWSRSASGDRELGLQIAAALWRFWNIRGHIQEGRDHLAHLLASGVTASVRVKALIGAGSLALVHDDYDQAESFLQEARTLAQVQGGPADVASAVNGLGRVAYARGDYETARSLLEESVSLQRAAGNATGLASALNNLALVMQDQGDLEAARILHEESLALDEALGDRRGVAMSLDNLGLIARARGDYAAARLFHERSLAMKRELGDKPGMAEALNNLGMVALAQDDLVAARTLYRESLTLEQTLGNRRGIAESLEELSALLAAEGNGEEAARLAGAAEALREAIHAPSSPAERAENARRLAPVRAALGAEAFAAAWAAGRALTQEQAVARALNATAENIFPERSENL